MQVKLWTRRRYRLPSPIKYLIRWFDTVVIRTQKWLEDEDKHLEAAVGWFLLLAALYLAGQVVRAL